MFPYTDEEADWLAGNGRGPRRINAPEIEGNESEIEGNERKKTAAGSSSDAVAGPAGSKAVEKTARDEGGGATMIRSFALATAVGLMFLVFGASAQEYARFPSPEPIKGISEILADVQARPDYESFGKVFYDRLNREVEITYVTKNGITKQVRIDAVTGEQRGTAWQH